MNLNGLKLAVEVESYVESLRQFMLILSCLTSVEIDITFYSMDRSRRNSVALIKYLLIATTLILISVIILVSFSIVAIIPVILLLFLSILLYAHEIQTIKYEPQKIILLASPRGPPRR